jgi:hypothetical protein
MQSKIMVAELFISPSNIQMLNLQCWGCDLYGWSRKQSTVLVLEMKLIVKMLIIIFNCLLCSCYEFGYGYIEAELQLAEESRIPKWFQLPDNYTRADVNVKIMWYSSCPGSCAKITLVGPPPENRKLGEKKGRIYYHPKFQQYEWNDYPRYWIFRVDSISEVIGRKYPGDNLCVSDDPELTYALEQVDPVE